MPGEQAIGSWRHAPERTFPAAVFSEITTGWRDSATPVVMAGMVGSNVGWKVAPYLPVPVDFSAIGQQLTSVGDKVWIIPGSASLETITRM